MSVKTITEIILKKFYSRPAGSTELFHGEIVFDGSRPSFDYNLLVGLPTAESPAGWWQPKRRLIAPLTLNVNAAVPSEVGADGSVGRAFKTVTAAINWIKYNLDPAGFPITLQLADGTYAPFILEFFDTSIIIRGNATNPANVVIAPAAGLGYAITANSCSSVTVRDLTIGASTNVIQAIVATTSTVVVNNVHFNNIPKGTNAVPGVHVYCINQSFSVIQNARVLGGAYSFAYSRLGGTCRISSAAVIGSPSFTYFGAASDNSFLNCESLITGTPTGGRASAVNLALVDTQNNFPATLIGTLADGTSGGFVK